MLGHGTNWIAEPIVTSVLSSSDYQINDSLSTDVPMVCALFLVFCVIRYLL